MNIKYHILYYNNVIFIFTYDKRCCKINPRLFGNTIEQKNRRNIVLLDDNLFYQRRRIKTFSVHGKYPITRTRKIVKKFHNKSLLFVCTESTELENFELKKMKISMWIRDISVWAGFNFRKLSLNLLVTFYWKFSTWNFLLEIFMVETFQKYWVPRGKIG